MTKSSLIYHLPFSFIPSKYLRIITPMKKFILLLCISSAHAENIDSILRKDIDFFEIRPIPEKQLIQNRPLVELGKRLFISPILSGNKNISCMTCHDPKLGTSDGKILSQNHNGKDVLARNSQNLFNTGLPSRIHLFWDGRVSFNPQDKTFQTPEESFNGLNPKRADITSKMSSALSMQAIFPIASMEEMRGSFGENEISNAKTNLEAWDLITQRVQSHPGMKQLLLKAYPNQQLFNIGHLGEALAAFIREEFHSDGSPFHRYLKGDITAMNAKEKEGLRVFIQRGKCIACHQGGELGLNTFYASVGVPQFSKRPFGIDLGRGNIQGENFKKYFFRTPSLLNLSSTGPYMHNGAYETIRDVINHYSNIEIFSDAFDLNSDRLNQIPVEIEINHDPKAKREIFNSIQAPFLKRGLNFTEDEKDALEAFLTNGIMDPKFKFPQEQPLRHLGR